MRADWDEEKLIKVISERNRYQILSLTLRVTEVETLLQTIAELRKQLTEQAK